jgi:hypothetical protein
VRITLASDPGKSGGYAVAFGSLDKIELYPWSEEDEFLAYLDELVNYEDSKGISAVVELVPPFVGKAIPGSAAFKLGYNYGFICGSIRANRIPLILSRPQDWQKGLPGLQGITGNPRKKKLRDHAVRLFPNLKGVTLKTCDALLILNHHLSH